MINENPPVPSGGVILFLPARACADRAPVFPAAWAASTALTDSYPWGLWIGFDVVCGVGLAAGGFTIAAMVYIFNVEKLPAHRPPGDPDRLPGLPAGHRRR